MRVPRGYCDLRVDCTSDNIFNAYAEKGYTTIAVNTTVDCSSLNVGTSNKKKRKISELYDENTKEVDCVPTPKSMNNVDSKLIILNRLTIQISKMGQLQNVMSSPNFKFYHIFAVEPLGDDIMQELVNSPYVSSVDIIACNTKTSIAPKDYTIAVDKQIYFELCYGPMLNDSDDRQEMFTLAHQLHIKGKSKNIIVSSGAVNTFDLRNPHDVMNLGFLFGLSKEQSRTSVTQTCYSVITKSYGRKIGKSATNWVQIQKIPQC